MNAKASPFVILLIPFATGIGMGSFLKDYLSLLFCLFGGSFVFLLYLYKKPASYAYRWLFGSICVLALFLIGACSVVLFDERSDPGHFAQKSIPTDFILAELCDVPSKGSKIKRNEDER